MIHERAPAYVLSMMVLVILAQRLAILNTADAAIWILTGLGLMVNLVTKAAGQPPATPRPPQQPPEAPIEPPVTRAALPDVRDDRQQ